MIKKFFIVLFILSYSAFFFSQSVPTEYKLGNEQKLSKSSSLNSSTPASNSITDIITVGNDVWLGTSRGVSLSTDKGETWTNFYEHEAFGTNSISAIGYGGGIFWAAKAYNTDLNGESVQTGGGFAFTSDKGLTWNTIPQPVDDAGDSSLVYGINDGVNLPAVRALPVTVPQQNLSFDIAFTPGTVWIASFAGGLRKSTDNGNSWQRVLLPSDSLNQISPDDTIRYSLQTVAGRFGKESNLNHRVFSVISINDSTLFVGTANGINKSTDGGLSWRKFNNGNQVNSISGNFVVGLGYQTSSNRIWGATWRAEGAAEFYGVSSSSDGGENWETFLNGERIHKFGFKTNSVIAPGDNGAFRSSNNGVSWILPTSLIDDQSGLTLQTNLFYSAASEGSNIWLGSADGLANLSETAGTMWNGRWKIFLASQPLASKTETYAYPNPFSPKQELLKIKYSTGGKNSQVTIRVFDFGMNYLRTIIQNAERGNPVHVIETDNSSANGVIDYWDGRDDSGNIVPNGVYFYRVEVGSDDPVYGKVLVIQ